MDGIAGFALALAACCSLDVAKLQAAETDAAAEAAAWAIVEQGPGKLQPPPAWRTAPPTEAEARAFQAELKESARTVAAAARDFLGRFPESEHASDARLTFVYALANGAAAGDPESEAEAARFVEEVIADAEISPEDKGKVLLMSSHVGFLKKIGMRFFTEGQRKFHKEMDAAGAEAILNIKERYPESDFLYAFLLSIAQRSETPLKQRLVDEILSSPAAPKDVRFFAEHLAKGTLPYEIGKPVEIRFTGLNGEEVDLAKMKGQVVLIDFWSTTCGPCIGQMPELKALYDKYREQGFRIIGINLDEKESALRRFLEKHEITWPQDFSGKGWASPLATRFGIFAIPANWLIDKQGNLRSTQARFNLDRTISRLLAEEP